MNTNNTMNPQSTPSYEKQQRDAAYWAQYTATLKVMNWAFAWEAPAQRTSSGSTRSPRWQRTSEW